MNSFPKNSKCKFNPANPATTLQVSNYFKNKDQNIMSQGTSKTGRPSKKKNHKEIHKCTNRNVKLHFESFTLKHYLLLPMTYQNLSIQKATVVH